MRYRTIAVALPLLGLLATTAAWRPASHPSDEQAIRRLYDEFSAAILAKDIDKVMSFYAKDERLVFFDGFVPRQYTGQSSYRKSYQEFFKLFPGKATSRIDVNRVIVSGPFAAAYGTDRWVVTGIDGKPVEMVFRFTNVFQKVRGKWLAVHEHLSFPADPVTGQADLMSKP